MAGGGGGGLGGAGRVGWHVPPRVGVPEGISLVFLLPYSPELMVRKTRILLFPLFRS